MQLKKSPSEPREETSQQELCDTSKPTSEPMGIKKHERQSNTKDAIEGTKPSANNDKHEYPEDNRPQEKSHEESTSHTVKTSRSSRKAPSTAKKRKRPQLGSNSQILPAGLKTPEAEQSTKMGSSTAQQKLLPQPSHLMEKKMEEPRGPGPFFYFGGGNGAQLVSSYCLNKGWQRIYDNKRDDYKLKWCEIKSSATYYAFREGEQLLYQIPNNKVLTTKIGLVNSLREYERVMQKINKARVLKMADFFPDTVRLDMRDEAEVFFSTYEDGQTWICKPTGLNQGRGIYLLINQEQILALRCQMLSITEDLKKPPSKGPQARIVQRYIPNPLLLEGKKFDIRSYLLIASTVPYFVFFRHGYVRLTCNPYDPKSDDLTGHLTNQYMQKKNPLYNELKEETVWSMERFNGYVNEKFAESKGLPQDWVLSTFTKRMQQIMIHCFLSVKSKLECRRGFFDLIGCDFLIDDDFKVWLLEMNCNPALHTNCEVLKEVIPSVVNETLDLALEVFHKSIKGHHILPLNTQSKYILLYNGETNEQTIKFNWPRSSSPVKTQRAVAPESLNGPVKQQEKPHKLLKPSTDNSNHTVAKHSISRSPQRATLAMTPVYMTGLYDNFTFNSRRNKKKIEFGSRNFDGPQNNCITEGSQIRDKAEQPTPIAKMSFSGPQKFRIVGRKTPQYMKRSTTEVIVTTSTVIAQGPKPQRSSKGSRPEPKDTKGLCCLENTHGNDQQPA
ncbi:inactive polyglycylase TTLL10 [Hyla sarda]|uniref:inactive polyglycylase TTLL10 n=1 Tax=Hyla sarda TaxID=327740 RepID=UPI0024C31126|nr:inactive polyglycylase TTLL10 [Hyla sarda]XP_056398644.1 inactive polyglycylase TTLL10 [Hyla sarda]XP_056398645.1 inactive polyglycylase TTLL10 [Hyla sarda]